MALIEYFPNADTQLTYAESLILDYLEDHLESISSLTITKTAEDNNVSTTTVVRLCKKLKVNSFSRLKFLLEEIYQEQNLSVSYDFYDSIERNFNETLKQNSNSTIEEVSQLLKDRMQIYIFAIGLSKSCGNYLEIALQQLGLDCSLIYDHQVIWSFDRPTIPNSLAIFISNSGDSKELISLLNRIKENEDLTTLSLVNQPNSQIEKLTDYSLHGYVAPVVINESDFSPHFSLILLIDLVIQGYLKTN